MNSIALCSIKYGNTHQELQSLLEDKYKLRSMPFSFPSCVHKYHPSCLTTLTSLPPEILTILYPTQIAHLHRRLTVLFQYSTKTAVEGGRSDTAG